jgi:hypothetical protein
MRALRVLLIVAVTLGGLFVIADRLAVNFAEDQAADKVRTTQGLSSTPSVSIKGFPFLTQVAAGKLDEVQIGIKDYETATANGDKIRISALRADMHGVVFSGDYSSATAQTATGTATITYGELLKAAKSEPTDISPGVSAKVVGLSAGGNGKIKVEIEATVLGNELPKPVSVLSTVSVKGDTVEVRADSVSNLGIDLAENTVRSITDFQQRIGDLPGGIKLDKVEGGRNGVEITVKGSDVRLAG